MNIITCNNINLIKNQQVILQNISFTAEMGDRISIMGSSGSGKSSLFRLLNLLISPTHGEILYNNKNVTDYIPTQLRQNIGYIPQKPYLFGTTVQENLLYPYQLLGQKANWSEINSYLEKVNLPKQIIEKKNTALSGGEQQRIALIRSLLVKPKVLLLDEITAALDEENTLLLEQLIIAEQKRHTLTLLFITHNQQQTKRLANKVLYLATGSIGFYGTVTDFSQHHNQGGNAHDE